LDVRDKAVSMARDLGRAGAVAAAALLLLAAVAYATSAATPSVPACSLSGTGHIQVCPVVFKATVGRASRVVVARYSDFSHCDFAAPSGEPGDNTHYIVASVTINWGDGTRTSGVAGTGTTCPGTDSTTAGANEPIFGTHRYKKRGTYTVSVSLTYIRGSGNTFQNCATVTPGSSVYSNLTNCIALNAPVQSIGIVRKK
jgi:hypothetical protein